MKHLRKCETLVWATVFALLLPLAMAPGAGAQSARGSAPVISHLPSAIGIKGKPLTILAHISDDTGVDQVILTLFRDGEEIPGFLPERPSEGQVPVRAIALEDLVVRSRADGNSRARGRLAAGVEFQVTQVAGAYYRIQTRDRVRGYVEARKTRAELLGRAYGASLPAPMTDAGSFAYRITARDRDGRSTSTPKINVRLLTAADIAALRSGRRPALREEKGGSGWKKFAIVSGLALLGGGAYLLFSQDGEEESTAVNVTVDWDK